MKKTLTLLFVLIFPFFCFSQVNEINFNHQNFDFSLPPRTNISPMSIRLLDNYNNGGPTAYGSILEIYGLPGHQTSQLYFGGWDNSRIRYREAFYGQNAWNAWITLLDSKNDVESIGNLKITGNANSYILNGNVGIGTTTPQSKLQVAGSITLPLPGTSEIAEEGISFAPNHRFNYDGKFINHYGFGFYPYSKSSDVGGVNAYMSGYYGLDFFTQDINRIRIAQGGNVGIGSTNPDQKLTVKGKIHAEEIIVDLAVPADYVFQKYYTGKSELKSDYTMLTLAEIESFTKKNNHLPNVPSAKEVEEKGVSLGEMSNVLLQKVEELTLYMIEMKKENDELKAQVKALMDKKQ